MKNKRPRSKRTLCRDGPTRSTSRGLCAAGTATASSSATCTRPACPPTPTCASRTSPAPPSGRQKRSRNRRAPQFTENSPQARSMDLPDETDDDVPRQSPDYRQRCSPSERSTTKLGKRRIRADCVNPGLASVLRSWARINPARPRESSGRAGSSRLNWAAFCRSPVVSNLTRAWKRRRNRTALKFVKTPFEPARLVKMRGGGTRS